MMSVPTYESESKKLLKAGQTMAALRLAEAAVAEHKNSAQAHYLHASIQERTARYEEALRSFRECLRLGGHKDASTRAEQLAAALERPAEPRVPTGLRSWHTDLPLAALAGIQNALHNYQYRGVNLQKNPFDFALYPMLIWQLKPRTIIEIGSKEGGSAIWMADLCDTFKLECHVHSIDIVQVSAVRHRRVTFYEGDGRAPGGVLTEKLLARLPRPWLVIEDADHSFETSMAVLDFFEHKLETQDILVMEDGIISELSQMAEGASGPHRALKAFLQRNFAEWEIIPEWCDFFGYNLTWNSNGFLRRTGLKKLSPDVAPELGLVIEQIKAENFDAALASLTNTSPEKFGHNYLRAYLLWIKGRLPDALLAAQVEVASHPAHRQARRLLELLQGETSGRLMRLPEPLPTA